MGWDSAKRGVVMTDEKNNGTLRKMSPEAAAAFHREREMRLKKRPRPERADDNDLHEPDDLETTLHYHRSLKTLAKQDAIFVKNLNIYERWNTSQRLAWILVIEKQAIDGHDTIGARLMAQVVADRMEG